MSVRTDMATPSTWTIIVRGNVSGGLALALGFQSKIVERSEPPHCQLSGEVRDQTELVGVISSLNDAGLQLLSVECQNLVNRS